MGLSDLGGAVTWGEARILIEEAAANPSTVLGADLAGWAYPATMPALLTVVVQGGKNAMKVMPWAMSNPRRQRPTADEVKAAQEDLLAHVVIAGT